ncbi:MAG TPA: MBL fold metallo-hydrolase [Acidimicrobiales bacterium]|jgi:glyoxylase-like metal-dependent hydrolase (beta-lactamase superfamily II)|nr:MBL fold metallo-hydrolase [Acidimicrobiales bacterium]
MDEPYQASPEIHVLPNNVAIPGVGVLPINAYVLRAEQPVLVDTGLGIDGDELIDAVASIVPLDELRWVWLTHDDADHTGAIARIFELAPQARLVTHGMCAFRMATWWPVPLDRVHAIRPGDRLHVGDRTLRAVAPPLFDNPMSTGLLDEASGALFSVDSFGALLPGPTQDAAEVAPDALAGGMTAWAASDSPWSHIVDRQRFAATLDGIRRLAPTQILSSHLPAAAGTSLEQFLDVIARVPDSEPMVAPDHEAFAAMVASLAPPEVLPHPAGV